MVVLKYNPRGKGPPSCPVASQLAFTDDRTSDYVWGRSVFGRAAATHTDLPRLAAEFYDKNLVGKDVGPRVGMTVVHTLKPTYGSGKVSFISNHEKTFSVNQSGETRTRLCGNVSYRKFILDWVLTREILSQSLSNLR